MDITRAEAEGEYWASAARTALGIAKVPGGRGHGGFEALMCLGSSRMRCGEYKDALDAYRSAVRISRERLLAVGGSAVGRRGGAGTKGGREGGGRGPDRGCDWPAPWTGRV